MEHHRNHATPYLVAAVRDFLNPAIDPPPSRASRRALCDFLHQCQELPGGFTPLQERGVIRFNDAQGLL